MRRAAMWWAAAALSGGLAIAGCKKQQTDAFAVIPKGTTHEFWKSVHGGARKAAQELGVNVIWKGPLREDEREDQIKVVENFINLRVRGIALAPLDDAALVPVVTDATRAGIPVVVFDSGLKSDDYLSFISTDNYKGGRLAGTELCRLLGGPGKVIMMRYAEGSASTMERERGFMDAIGECKGVEVVSSNQYGGATTETAFKTGENLLNAHKDAQGLTVQGIFTPNESTTFGMLRALEDGGFAGKVKFVGFDSSEKLIDAMTKGALDAVVVQDPMMMGYRAVKALTAKTRGEAVDRRVDTGAYLVTRENMNEARSQELLRPPFAQYLK